MPSQKWRARVSYFNEVFETSSRAVSMERLDTSIWDYRSIGSILPKIVKSLENKGESSAKV